MSVSRCVWLALVLLPGAVGLAQNQSSVLSASGNISNNTSSYTYAQIVRISLVEGDVRVSRGKDVAKKTGAEWEKAVADLPMESGYSLVTGAGRAEIEFEDASTVYLAENSVLVFNDLSTTGGAPNTELALLSGTVSLALTPMALGELFSVRTPANRFAYWYPSHHLVRLNSYLDGTTLTPLESTVFGANPSAFPVKDGQTITYHNGRGTVGPKSATNEFADFDQWVLQRVTARSSAMAETMKEAGLTEPVPGLAQLQGQGHFYSCPPYGTCWEPTNGFAGPATEADKAAMARQTVSVAGLQQGGAQSNPGTTRQPKVVESVDYYPCSPLRVMSRYEIDPVTGKRRLLSSQLLGGGFGLGSMRPYTWAVCHTGSWIRREGRYAWVPGRKRHHHHPVHWVQTGHRVGYVPIHPRDVAGKPPVNLKDGIIHPVGKQGGLVDRLAYTEGQPVTVLAGTPEKFRWESVVPLERAEAPHAEARMLAGPGVDAKVAMTPITFDHKTQSFMVARETILGGATRTIAEPIGGRGSSLQAQAGGGSGGSAGPSMARGGGSGTYHGGGNAGGASRSSSAPAASSSSSASAHASSGSSGGSASSAGSKH